jgi:hypothetical protein
MPSAPSGEDAFIYLGPSLERESQAQVDFTVAHEFAHAPAAAPHAGKRFSVEEGIEGRLFELELRKGSGQIGAGVGLHLACISQNEKVRGTSSGSGWQMLEPLGNGHLRRRRDPLQDESIGNDNFQEGARREGSRPLKFEGN